MMMQPKDLLVHLEGGDRTLDHLADKISEERLPTAQPPIWRAFTGIGGMVASTLSSGQILGISQRW